MNSLQRIARFGRKQTLPMMIASLAFLSLACGCNLSSILLDMVGGVEGFGEPIAEVRQVEGIRAVEVSNQGDLFVELGAREMLVVEAQQNLLPYIQTDIRDGTLRIYTSGTEVIRPTSPIRYQLTVKSLDQISLTSSGDAALPEMEAEEFTIRVSSSGDLDLDGLVADRVEVQILSSGNVRVGSGQVREQSLMLSSSGDYQAEQLRSQTVEAMLASSGSAWIYVTSRLDAVLSSSGDLYYRGNPELKVSITSSGGLIPLGE